MDADPELTANQRRVLAMIRDYLDRNGHAPSLREISEYLGLSSHSSAQDYVEALIRKGALERSPKHRGLRLVQRSRLPQRRQERPRSRLRSSDPTLGHPRPGSREDAWSQTLLRARLPRRSQRAVSPAARQY